jgi:hypothetical protein
MPPMSGVPDEEKSPATPPPLPADAPSQPEAEEDPSQAG